MESLRKSIFFVCSRLAWSTFVFDLIISRSRLSLLLLHPPGRLARSCPRLGARYIPQAVWQDLAWQDLAAWQDRGHRVDVEHRSWCTRFFGSLWRTWSPRTPRWSTCPASASTSTTVVLYIATVVDAYPDLAR